MLYQNGDSVSLFFIIKNLRVLCAFAFFALNHEVKEG